MKTYTIYYPASHVISESRGEGGILLDLKTGRFHALNNTAYYIWVALSSGLNAQSIIRKLLGTFDATGEEVHYYVIEFMESLQADGLLQERSDYLKSLEENT